MSPAPGGKARPLGFLLLVLGLGVKMDSEYDAFAWLLIVAGAATAAVGLWELLRLGTREAFVPRRAGE